MQVPVRNLAGEVVEQFELEDEVFAVPFNEAVVHQAMVRQLANARQGTADTKTRSEIAASTRKMYRQKHTGWARRGSRRASILRGGGVAFGPHPRSYRQKMPKKMRRLALRSVLSAKASSSELIVVDRFGLDAPNTAAFASALKALNVQGRSLVVTADAEQNVIKSARNLPGTRTLPAGLLNVADLLSYKYLIISKEGVDRVQNIWGREKSGKEAN